MQTREIVRCRRELSTFLKPTIVSSSHRRRPAAATCAAYDDLCDRWCEKGGQDDDSSANFQMVISGFLWAQSLSTLKQKDLRISSRYR